MHVALAVVTGYLLQHAIWEIELYLCKVYGIGGADLFSCGYCMFNKLETIITFALDLLGVLLIGGLLIFRSRALYISNLIYFTVVSAFIVSYLISPWFSFSSIQDLWSLLVLTSIWYVMYSHRRDFRKPKEKRHSTTTNNL